MRWTRRGSASELAAVLLVGFAAVASAAPTRSSPLAVSGDVVFVVNPDSDSVTRIEYDAMHHGTVTQERSVGRYPRTVAIAGGWVFTADQKSDTISRLAAADLDAAGMVDLGVGCNPYGVVATPDEDTVLATCQGRSELLLLDPGALAVRGRIALPWPNARALAVSSDGSRAFVTHYLTEEPGTEAHVSVVDLGPRSVATVFAVPADASTCETPNSGQGVLNLVSAIALVPDDAPADVRNQLWIGGTQENNVSKGLFKRYPAFAKEPGAGLFPLIGFTPFPEPATPGHRKPFFPGESAVRNLYRAALHDITRFGIYKLDATDGRVVGKIDVDEANNATDIEFSADGTTAYVVDVMFNSLHVVSTRKGQGGDVTTVFAPPSAFGPGGAAPSAACVPDPLGRAVADERPFRIAPQAQLRAIDGYEPIDGGFNPVATGVDFDTAAFVDVGVSRMRPVADGIGTAPIGVRLSHDGTAVYVANYLARNVVAAAAAAPVDAGGTPVDFRCTGNPAQRCATDGDCPRTQGFCNHPGGPACTTAADCGDAGPCVRRSDCVPLLLGPPVPTVAVDPIPASILDGKILFNTAARDGSVDNGIGLVTPVPAFNDAAAPANARRPGSVVSTSRDASYVTCSTCHADFGGQDGRTWDFSQLGASLRNTMELRGRPAFAPGRCASPPHAECFFDAACGPGVACRMREDLVPPHVRGADRERYFNPMLTAHWNGDRDEVEDFEHTFRSLMGAGDCDGLEDATEECLGALVQRSTKTSTDPIDVNVDLGAPNRNLRGSVNPSTIAGIRLTHVADFVYSLTEFVENPNPADEAAARGGRLFTDPQTRCAQCHDSRPAPTSGQFFTDKRPQRSGEGFDPALPAAADRNNPFVRHDVGSANLFDRADPNAVASVTGTFQNARTVPPIPAPRDVLAEYVTPVLNDVWNTRPYLHDGSAHTLLDVVRPCTTRLDRCLEAGRGRNLDDRHGRTSMLTPRQLNDLVAFLKTLALDTPLGRADVVVRAGSLSLSRATLALTPRRTSLRAAGRLRNPAGAVDPSGGAVVSLATPGGETMAIFSRPLTMTRRGGRFIGQLDDETVELRLALRPAGRGRFRFTARARGAGLAVLDTGNRDLTVALEIDGVSFVRNRNLAGRRRVFHLPRRRG